MNARTRTALAGRHALVTGASRGIGAAIARVLVGDGMLVTLCARDGAALRRLTDELGGEEQAVGLVTDIADPVAVRGAFAKARQQFGPVEVLINNAGQAASAKFTDTDEALWTRLISVNLTGTYLCSREAIPDMLERGFGRIVNVASIAGLRGAPLLSAYATSKHAVVGLTRSLALEYATQNITVNAVCPGYVETDMVKGAVANIMRKTGRSEAEARATLIATNPQGRLVEADEVADTVLWLCRPGAESITGQSIVLAGGGVT